MQKEARRKSSVHAVEALRKLLSKKGAGTQEDLRSELARLGLKVTQSTISRCLRKVGAIKIFSPNGDARYRLPASELESPVVEASIAELIKQVSFNESMIVIHTAPGSAQLIARQLDHIAPGRILGTIAGNDTIFVAPVSGRHIKKISEDLNSLFRR